MARDIEVRINEAFDRYNSTIGLLEEYGASRSNAHEYILLACASLDSLSNAVFSNLNQKDGFVKLLHDYAGHRILQKVSIPDLYHFFQYHLWILFLTIAKAGRIKNFGGNRDNLFSSFIWDSDLAITEEEIGKLIKFILRELQKSYRVKPYQPRSKVYSDSVNNIYAKLLESANSQTRKKYVKAIESIRPILNDHKIGAILYREYRCGVIHDYGFNIDEEFFFDQEGVYWATYVHHIEEIEFLKIQFPSQFLLSLLTNSINGVRNHLLHTKMLPFEIWNQVCEVLELEYLDENTVPDGQELRPR